MKTNIQNVYKFHFYFIVTLLPAVVLFGGCNQNADSEGNDSQRDSAVDFGSDSGSDAASDSGSDAASDSESSVDTETDPSKIEFNRKTISIRSGIEVPDSHARLSQQELLVQLPNYDPGSLLRCGLNENPSYRAAVDELGGIQWGYSVSMLEDQSTPIFQAGIAEMHRMWDDALEVNSAGGEVEIVEADIVGLNEDAALFASNTHGLLLVDLSGDAPQFVCAAKLPGISSKFYYYNGKLTVMAKGIVPGAPNHSFLLHFDVGSDALTFIEAIDLGVANVLDSRRFNERLVIYTDMVMEESQTISQDGLDTVLPVYSTNDHRRLRVFNWGDTLVEELSETQISDEEDLNWIQVSPDTHQAGDLVHQSSSFGRAIWASNRYFVITESIHQTFLAGFENKSYRRCTESHTVKIPYTYCYTVYEERPNPNYTPPDNTGGDRACNGTTLGECLRHVATVSNKTIQVPVDRICEARKRTKYICDAYETVQYTVPNYDRKIVTKLAIYEYTEAGFIRFASEVAEIQDDNLTTLTLTDSVDTLTTSTEKFDLQIGGNIQTLYFQNGFLYVIAQGVLQVYAMGDNSLVRTSNLQVVNDSLQTSLFTDDTIYLSDFSWTGHADTSQLKLVNLSNPGFPTIVAQTQELPGGHSHILAIKEGIFTIGKVSKFEGQNISALKLGLFGDPAATELAYLILGTDLSNTNISTDRQFYFNYGTSQLFLPYTGQNPDTNLNTYRVGISHLDGPSIVSDGALETPEPLLRVRPEPGSDRMMGFSNNLIESFVSSAGGWEVQPLLEYYTPIAVYRFTDSDDHLELLRLGNLCKFHITKGDKINDRNPDAITAPIPCPMNTPWAYEQNLIFNATFGLTFDLNGNLTPLTEEQIAAFTTARLARPYCLLSTTDVLPYDQLAIDFASSTYSMDDFTCMSPEEYWALVSQTPDTDTPTVQP